MANLDVKDEDLIYVNELVALMELAIEQGRGFSVVRVGDGENAVLAGTPTSEGYCGVNTPNPAAAKALAEAIRHADVVGIFPRDEWTTECFTLYDLQPAKMMYAFDNLYWCCEKSFLMLLKKHPLVLIGKSMPQFRKLLEEKIGAQVADVIVIKSFNEIEDVLARLKDIDFKVAVISAGVNADILATQIKLRFGKVGIDFGHAVDHILAGDQNMPFRWQLVQE